MLKITDVKLSKNTVATGEKFTISVQIQERLIIRMTIRTIIRYLIPEQQSR
mgnify:CR=1 FL=1